MAKFKIGAETKDKSGNKYKPVLLNDKEIFKIDLNLYAGHRRDQNADLLKALSKELGYEVDRRQLNSAMIVEQISDTRPIEEEPRD